uniref:Bestrophin homolog n=1 Tax=Caenorhabditis japonica TaxID=281687 RepID=A0A8R1HRK5_CAEJA
MTVSYALTVSSASYCAFWKLLKKWKGSILKAVWAELVVWLLLYAIISIIINLCFDIETTRVALTVSTLIRGKDDNVRLARRSIIRYLVLSQAMVYRDISMRVRRRFPTMKSLVEAGFLFENELRELESTENGYNKYWMPINWCNSIVSRMQEQKYIDAPVSTNNVLNWYRYIPLIPAMSFLFYIGWMKVAEALLNPFGEDDDDFEGNWVIDKNIMVILFTRNFNTKNLQTGMQIVDEGHSECPDLNIDQFSDPKFGPMYPILLPKAPNQLQGSAADVVIPETEKSRMVHVDSQSSMTSMTTDTTKDRQSSIRKRRTTSAPRQTLKSPGGESVQSAFSSNLQFVTEEKENEENNDPRADLRIYMGNDNAKK